MLREISYVQWSTYQDEFKSFDYPLAFNKLYVGIQWKYDVSEMRVSGIINNTIFYNTNLTSDKRYPIYYIVLGQ